MTPADRFLDVFDASPLFQQASEGLAVEGISRFEFTNGEFGLGHGVSQRITQLMQSLVDPHVFLGSAQISDTVDFHFRPLGKGRNLHAGSRWTHARAKHLGIESIDALEIVQIGQEHRGADDP